MDSGVKYDKGKPRMELLSPSALQEIAKVMTHGAKKYGDYNWLGGMKHSRLYGAALRHITSHLDGEDLDEETGISHLAHAGCCLMMLLTYEIKGLGTDDRYLSEKESSSETRKYLTTPEEDDIINTDCTGGCQCSRTIGED